MTSSLRYAVHGDTAVLTLANPPVNSLNLALRRAVADHLALALADDRVAYIVITGAGALFSAGADIREFTGGDVYAAPARPELCARIEAATKPVFAVLNGTALGGGFELALACHYRLARNGIKAGLPEVNLGILPGAGGTQRLPRLGGIQLALDMVVGGRPVTVEMLCEAGAVDAILPATGDVIAAAIDHIHSSWPEGAQVRRCADLSIDPASIAAGLFSDYRTQIAPTTKGLYAPERCIQAVEAACTLPLADGLARENALFHECLGTPQARALEHNFLAERASAQIPGISPGLALRHINSVAIIGAGTMGSGIAMCFINAGISVTLLEVNADTLARGLARIRDTYEYSANRGKLSADDVARRMALVTGTTSYGDLAGADLVIEAVFENLDVKIKVFGELDRVCKSGAILASNTSYQDIDLIAQSTSRPADVVGLHFFSPANVMRLLEVVRGRETSPQVLATCLKLGTAIGKLPVVSGVCWGFIGNRMYEAFGREAGRLLLEGATATQVDKALTDFGMAMGFFAVADLAGIDVVSLAHQAVADRFGHDPSYFIVGNRLYQHGHHGQKTGRGYHSYEGRKCLGNPETEAIARQAATELGIQRRQIADQEIVERCLYSLINEGARVLEEGIAYRSGDIDLVFVNGYGFPAWRGGPMHYANEIGVATVLDRLHHYRGILGTYGEMWFQPAPLLERMAKDQLRFK